MNVIKKHICPTCGGSLIVNVERQMYECPFCGVTFDYDYFREENVLGIAAQALENKEFTSAGRAYDFLLEKEPNNFEALLGKALVAMEIPKIDDIRWHELFSKLNYETTFEAINRAIESSKSQDREYFTVMKDIVDAGHDYINAKDEIETQRTERNESLSALGELVRERDTVFIYASPKVRPKKAVFITVLCYILFCLMVFLGFKYFTRNPYSKAEDLSKYEKDQTEDSKDNVNVPGVYYNNSASDMVEELINYSNYKEAFEREEQRRINYNNWEKAHENLNSILFFVLGIATFFYALIVFVLFIGGRLLNIEISRIQANVDEHEAKIKELEESMTENKKRIKQGYNRLCELHTINGII